MADRIKVLLANESQALLESLKGLIQNQVDMEIVGEVVDPIELLLAVDETQAEVVILALNEHNKEPGIFSHLFAEFPQLRILTFTPEHEDGFLYQQIISKEQFSSRSGDDILAAIRKAKIVY